MKKKYSQKLFEINQNWTSLTRREDWTHYRISGRRKVAGGLELEMMAVCDREIRFWISLDELKNPELWEPGWGAC